MAEEVVTRALRFDLSQGNLDKRRTTEGGIIVDANISRVGIFKYANADGSERRELRAREEVFKKSALDSFAHSTLTVEHPATLVDPKIWKQVAVGHVGDTVQPDGNFVAAPLYIQDDATIGRIERGELKELSCGYQCRLDMTPGVHPEFGEYDARQIDIVGNHVAIGPKDWGRAGPEVKMHLDGGAGVSGLEPSYVRAMAAAKAKADETTVTDPPATGDPPGGARTDRADSDRLAGENAQLRAENERLSKEAAARKDATKEAEEQARVDARVEARGDLLAKAAPILTLDGQPPYRGTGKTDDQIKREVLAVLEPDMKFDGKSADFVAGAFDSAIARADRVQGGWRELGDVLRPDSREEDLEGGARTAPRKDGRKDEEEETVEDAQAGMVAKQKDAWMPKGKGDRGKRDKGARDARSGR